MKFDRSVKEQRTPKGFHYYIEGPGRVDDSKPIDLAEKVAPDIVVDSQPGYKIGSNPYRIKFSKEKGNTMYDVVADFSEDGKESMLKQFQKLILSDQN